MAKPAAQKSQAGAATTKSAKDAAKDAAAKLKQEREEAATRKEEEKANKAKDKEEEKEAKAAARKEEADKRKALKAGPGKLLRSFLARIKYMRYMDNPSSSLDGIENLAWELSITNSEGTIYTATRGGSVDEVSITTKENGKKAVTEVIGNDDESLDALAENLKP